MRRYLAFLLLLSASLLGAGEVLHAQPNTTTHESVVLLDNGHVLEGQVIDEGDRLLISVEDWNLDVGVSAMTCPPMPGEFCMNS